MRILKSQIISCFCLFFFLYVSMVDNGLFTIFYVVKFVILTALTTTVFVN